MPLCLILLSCDSDVAANKAPTSGVGTAQVTEALITEQMSSSWWQPTADQNLTWQWQLQGDVDTSRDVNVYNIDMDVPIAKVNLLKARDIKVICYFSAGTVESFRDDASLFPASVVGEQYEDLGDEHWIDYGNIAAIAPIMRARMDRCVDKGFDAIEADNVDAHNYESRNTEGAVTHIGTNFNTRLDESKAYVKWLADEAHKRGLALGLKNAEEMAADIATIVDWMIVEDCYYDNWCALAQVIVENNKPVFMAEYTDLVPDFTPACDLAKALGYSAIWRDPGLELGTYLACE